MENYFDNLSGEVINYDIIPAINKVTNNPFDDDNFYPACGCSSAEGEESSFDADSNFDAESGADGEFSEASGLFKNFHKNQKIRQKRRDEKQKSKAQARVLKSKAKLGLADAQKTAAKSLQDKSGDIEMAEALAKSAPAAEEKTGMSTGLKIGIGVGIVAVLGVIGFVVYKKMKKK